MVDKLEHAGKKIVITDRCMLCADGVKGILSFDDDFVRLDTSLGELCVEGVGLVAEELSRESGKVVIKGEMLGVFYQKTKEKRGRGKLIK